VSVALRRKLQIGALAGEQLGRIRLAGISIGEISCEADSSEVCDWPSSR
jgi:hypothetical protein